MTCNSSQLKIATQIDLKVNKCWKNKAKFYIDKGTAKDADTIINIYAPNSRASKYLK